MFGELIFSEECLGYLDLCRDMSQTFLNTTKQGSSFHKICQCFCMFKKYLEVPQVHKNGLKTVAVLEAVQSSLDADPFPCSCFFLRMYV
jgi:hypothetical protein